MALKHFVLNLSGAAQRLSQVYASGAGNAQPSAAEDIPYRQVFIQAFDANSNDVYVGSSNAVSASNYGFHLDAANNIPPVVLGPFETGPIKLSDIWVIGTLNEDISILGVPF